MRCKSDRIMSIKLVLGAEVLNVICVSAPQMGLSDDIKSFFWEELEEVLQGIHMEVSGLGKETVEGWHFWTLL